MPLGHPPKGALMVPSSRSKVSGDVSVGLLGAGVSDPDAKTTLNEEKHKNNAKSPASQEAFCLFIALLLPGC